MSWRLSDRRDGIALAHCSGMIADFSRDRLYLKESALMVAYQKNEQTGHSLVHPKYRPDIDGLRAIAVLLVVIYHAFPTLVPGGFVGVDVFFVISGFLISTIIFKSLERSSFSIIEFYKRRVNRIFPALLVVISACLIFGWFALFPDEYEQLGKHVAGGAGFVSNIVLWSESGYFDTTADIKPLLHLWSLGIEEQFYIAFPLLAFIAWKLRVNKLAFVLVALLSSFALNIYLINYDAVSTFFLPQTRAWELLIGSALACVLMRSDTKSKESSRELTRAIAFTLSSIGIALIVGSAFFMAKDFSFPGWWAALPCAGALLLIYAGPSAWLNRSVLSSKPFVWVGLISFPLYLWHWPLLSFARIIEGDTPSVAIRASMVVAAVVLSAATYLLIEKPLKGVSTKYKAITLVLSVAAIGGVGYYVYSNGGLPEREAAKSTEKFNGQFVSGSWQYNSNEECVSKYPLLGVKDYAWWFCMSNKDTPPSVMVIGNSFANHLYPAIANSETLSGNSVLNIGTCSIDIMGIDIEPLDRLAPTSPCAGNRSKDQLELIKSIIKSSGTVKYAIISGLHDGQSPETIGSVQRFVSFLKENNVKPVIFVPHVSAYKDLKGCFARPFKSPSAEECVLPLSEREGLNKRFQPLLDALSKTDPGISVFDQNDLHCDSEKCSLVIDGMPLFRDQYSHYSVYASEKLGAMFAEWAKVHAPGLLSSK